MPHQAFALALDVSREELRLAGLAVGARLDEVDACAFHCRAGAEGDMSGDGASCLREARCYDLVGLHELLVALGLIGLYGVFVVRACQRTCVLVGVF